MARPATGHVLTRKLANGDTRYAIKFRANGERQYETLGTDAEGWDRQRAQETLEDRLAEVRLGTFVAPRRAGRTAQNAASDEPSFHEFASRWFAMVEPELETSTVEAIRWRLSYVLLPFFQHHRLSEITIEEVDRYRAAKVRERDLLIAARDAGEKTDRRPLANSTINRTIQLLGQILDVAVEYGHLPANPARGKRRKLKVRKPRRSYLDSATQIVALLNAADELDREARADRQHLGRQAMLATPTFASVRLGELLAIQWPEVDLAGGWINISDAKTDAGVRKSKLRPVLRDMLAARKASLTPEQWKGLVFATSNGNPHSPSNVRRMMCAVCKRANEHLEAAGQPPLPAITPHSLRRTWASVMFAIGEPIPTVMADGGWADPELPLTIYAHAMRRDEGENERLRALVEGTDLAGLVPSDHSDQPGECEPNVGGERASRSATGV